jgi:hypothetical protein
LPLPEMIEVSVDSALEQRLHFSAGSHMVCSAGHEAVNPYTAAVVDAVSARRLERNRCKCVPVDVHMSCCRPRHASQTEADAAQTYTPRNMGKKRATDHKQ